MSQTFHIEHPHKNALKLGETVADEICLKVTKALIIFHIHSGMVLQELSTERFII